MGDREVSIHVLGISFCFWPHYSAFFCFVFWLQNYFSCFFSLPIVISSMRWGIDAGRKTMVRIASCLTKCNG